MTFYPTTLLPPSLPYAHMDDIMLALTDRCLAIAEDPVYSHVERDQYFDITMSLVNFWMEEENNGHL
jgi:hypothetical protein